MLVVDDFKDYEIIDSSNGMKLERWGNIYLLRPDPQVIWDNGNLLEKYPNIKDITDIKIIKEEDKKNKISLNLFVTCLEDITEYQEIDNNKETS